jgi:hypothetical protein
MDREAILAASSLRYLSARLAGDEPLESIIPQADRKQISEAIDLVLEALLLTDCQLMAMRRLQYNPLPSSAALQDL